ncbi:heptaprenyl diphosphate synthase component II [Salirhabdus salicampi]|uniref:heptaprenyl diphosphate synthase component II n=1 Tax=Salirhabdus salicampi TaxID=476102 RepID=UPI0020C23C70|nr:heptaprenyl diphosphate synthase component II [Salirhabdus salicampi]MCP8616702.1 heptaprenyl diphosphate synthase component II [Salirhabdus salicampi]
MKLSTSYYFLKDDINKIDKELLHIIQAEHSVLRAASTQLLQAGGKRIRPVFVLLAAQFGEYNFERVKKVAIALELIHMATLVHDDVIDDAQLRRGKETVKSKWDNRVAMYTGDFMIARALEVLSEANSAKAHQILSRGIVEVCLGEIEQLKDQYNVNQNIRTYLRRIKRKTALLIAISCRLGAAASDLDEKSERALFRYGYYIGMSYQIIDDILDFTSTDEELGKPAGSDLMNGNITLPVLYLMRDQTFKDKLEKKLSKRQHVGKEDVKDIIEEVKTNNAIDYAYEISDRYLQKAFQQLDQLPDNRAKNALKQIAKYIGKRTS